MQTFTFAVAIASLVTSVRAQDRYQKIGNDVGSFYSSVGAVLADPNGDYQSLSVAAQQADVAIASFKNEIRTMDWSDLGAAAAQQQTANLELYVNGLDNANSELHAIASKAAVENVNNKYNNAKDNIAQQPQQASQYQQFQQQAQPQPQQHAYANNRVNAAVTGFQNKAVVKEASGTITSSSEPTETSSTLNSKESKSESRSSKKEEKSESRSSKKEEKSESRSSKKEEKSESKESKKEEKSASSASASSVSASATTTHAAGSNGTVSSSTPKHSKNNAMAVATGISGSALFAAVLAFI